MRWFENLKDVFENINRSVLLGVGLVVVAVLVAATFVVGDTDQVAEENNNQTQQESTQEEQQSSGEESGSEGGTEQESSSDQNGDQNDDQNDDGEASPQNSEGQVSSETSDNNEQTANNGEQAPDQLADTGPVSAAAALALGTGGYLYHRSRKNLGARRQDS